MELLIVLGLCFGAYELLGVFQGCFHYNDHPLPYQPQAHNINGNSNSINNNSNESNNNSNDTKDSDNENEQSNNEQDDENCLDKVENRRRNHSKASVVEDEDDEILDSLKSGPCSCYSNVTEDDYDDDTRVILRNNQYSQKRRRQQILRKPINKFSLSTSLMSLSRDDTNFLFNYFEDINNSKFSKFKSEIEISETSFNNLNKYNENSYNDNRINRNCHHHFDRSSIDLDETTTDNNEDITCNRSVNLDSNKKKIFFISAAS